MDDNIYIHIYIYIYIYIYWDTHFNRSLTNNFSSALLSAQAKMKVFWQFGRGQKLILIWKMRDEWNLGLVSRRTMQQDCFVGVLILKTWEGPRYRFSYNAKIPLYFNERHWKAHEIINVGTKLKMLFFSIPFITRNQMSTASSTFLFSLNLKNRQYHWWKNIFSKHFLFNVQRTVIHPGESPVLKNIDFILFW